MKKFLKWSLSENQAYSQLMGNGECVTNGLALRVNLGVILFLGCALAMCSLVESVM